MEILHDFGWTDTFDMGDISIVSLHGNVRRILGSCVWTAEYDALGIQACQIMFMSKGNFNQVYSNFQSIT